MSPVDVLAVAAHPDDAEVGCGGALLLSAQAGLRTAIVDLTASEASTRGTMEIRGQERDRASAVLGLQERVSLGLPDGHVGTAPDHRIALLELVRALRPRIVLAPFTHDRHPDHAGAGRLAREACALARSAKIGRGDAHVVSRVYHYMLHYPFEPSFVVDISPVWTQKLAAIEAYESQFGRETDGASTEISGGGFLGYLKARAVVHGAMVGASVGEPYHHTGPLALQALPDPGPDDGRERPYSMFT